VSDRNRQQILSAIRRHAIAPHARPDNSGPWTEYAAPLEQFRQVLESVGGQLRYVANWAQLSDELQSLPAYRESVTRCCQLPVAGQWNVELDTIDDPHDLASLDLAVMRGEFAVAENGAVWVRDTGVRQRSAYFIAQHLVLIVPTGRVYSNLHQAYAQLTFHDNTFGCFISGPSKTADIEQSLVIGAHGARSLTVFVGSLPE